MLQGSTGVTLTDRERQVATLLASGLGRKKIADRLDISLDTVEWHLKQIGDKVPGNGRRGIRITRFVLQQSSTRAA